MAVFALCSVKGSPGVTTSLLALAAVWPQERSPLLVDADPDGGDLAARVGLPIEPGMASLAAAGRRTLERGDLERHVQTIPGGVPALVGNADPDQAARELELVAGRLAEVLQDGDVDVLVDLGRLRSGSPATPLAMRADVTLIVCRPRVDELQHVRARIGRLTEDGCRVALLLVGETPYSAVDVESAIGCDVVAAIADDARTAASFAGLGGRVSTVSRSPLVRSARALAERLVGTVQRVAVPAVPEPPDRPIDTPAADMDEVVVAWTSRVSGNGNGNGNGGAW